MTNSIKKLFRDILSLDVVASNDERRKRLLVYDRRVPLTLLEETRDNLIGNLEMTRHLLSPRCLDLTWRKTNAQNRLRNAKQSSHPNINTMQITENELTQLKNDIKIIDAELRVKNDELDSLLKEIEKEQRELEKLESTVKDIQWDNRTKDVSIHTKIERILESHGVTIQTYHGGSLTGGAILVLIKKT
jgi:chromosome segregation ATPase